MSDIDAVADEAQPLPWSQKLAGYTQDFRAPLADEINTVAALVSAATRPAGGDDVGAREVELDDIYLAAAAMPDLHDRLTALERQLLEAARDRGESWSAVAQRLGRGTAQAMQQHYRRSGGDRNWPRSPPVAHAREALKQAVHAAGLPYDSTAHRILVVTGLRRAMNKALSVGAMTAESMRSAISCSDYTFALARDVDHDADDPLPDPGDETYLPLLLAIEMMLEDQWWATPPEPGTLATRHPAAPTPVRAWNALASAAQEDYLAHARVQLSQPAAPNWHPWLDGWRTWHRLFSIGTVVARQKHQGFGPWEFYDPADTELGHVLFDCYDDQLLDLMEAGLTVVNPDGQAIATPPATTRRERIRTYIQVS